MLCISIKIVQLTTEHRAVVRDLKPYSECVHVELQGNLVLWYVVPHTHTQWKNVQRYEQHGTSLNLNKEVCGWRRTGRSQQNIQTVQDALTMIKPSVPDVMELGCHQPHSIASQHAIGTLFASHYCFPTKKKCEMGVNKMLLPVSNLVQCKFHMVVNNALLLSQLWHWGHDQGVIGKRTF